MQETLRKLIGSGVIRRQLVCLTMTMSALCLAACAGKVGPAARELPKAPARLWTAPAVPHLSSACYFPWRGVPGCKGEDMRAMLRLTVSDSLELRARLAASPVWYENVRRDYRLGKVSR